MISMLAGKPNPSLFPITSLSVTIRSPVTGEETILPITGKTLDDALQYGATGGQADIVRWFKRLQEISHHRNQTSDWDLTIGSGSQDLLYKVSLVSRVRDRRIVGT
jgi:tryptophan aminotransferase